MREARQELQEWPWWHVEYSGRGRVIAHKLTGPWLFEGREICRTELGSFEQLVQIGEFEEFGRGLVIDGMSQLAEAIDPIYTSALVFPAAISAPSRRRWFIAGGGDGAAVREALAFQDTEEVWLADLSELVISKTQELIPSFWGGCQNDPRLKIVKRDAFATMRELAGRGEKFDIVISDLTDPEDPDYTPFGESTADHLYTDEAVELFAALLPPDGVFAMQAQECSLLRSSGHRLLRQLLRKHFRFVYSYRVFIEFFGYWEGFLIVSNVTWAWHPAITLYRPIGRVRNRYQGRLFSFYGQSVHGSLFALPSILEERVS